MLATLKQTLQPATRLCVARSLTTSEQWIQTHPVSKWKTMAATDLARKPAIFLFQAAR
jgi:16S rRNA (cytidine1402-2'-O)-methyltransferase